tara:strand:- start:289 stop:465 length:177 start_codon:yes stop_codon:yes gene_type:complete
MNDYDQLSEYFSEKNETDLGSRDWDSLIPYKLKKGSRIVAKYQGQYVVQLADGSHYMV